MVNEMLLSHQMTRYLMTRIVAQATELTLTLH